MTIKTKGLLTVLFAYTLAIGLGIVSIFVINMHEILIHFFRESIQYYLGFWNDLVFLLEILIADVVATCVIYGFSVVYKNSSFYDPYWSVIPPFILFFCICSHGYPITLPVIALTTATIFWSIRLTLNWMKTWEGLHHEDWRYIDMRNRMGKQFQLLGNFGGIHMYPTLQVFFCCVPMYFIVQESYMVVNFSQLEGNIILPLIGFAISMIGILFEIIADQQLHDFRMKHPTEKKVIQIGLWNYSRHPNYYGEILFWWGIYLMGFLQSPWWLLFAPITMTILFIGASIPWIEMKILRTRPEYREYQKKVHILFPEITILKRLFGRYRKLFQI